MEEHVEEILTIIEKLKSTLSKESSKKLDLDKSERVVQRLAAFSESCAECQQELLTLKDHYIQLESNIDVIDTEVKQHKKMLHHIVSHLQKKHKLVPENMYFTLYMSIGISLGMVFGLTIFDNVALGISIGMSIGIGIGAGLDADAKKKGMTI